LACAAYFLAALVADAIGSILPLAMAELRVGLQLAGAFQYLPAAAVAVVALGAVFLVDRLGAARTVLAGLALFAAAALALQALPGVAAALVLVVLAGVGISLFKLGTVAMLGRLSLSPARHGALMTAVEGCYATGSVAAPLLVMALERGGAGWRGLYLLAAAIALLLWLCFLPFRERAAAPLTVAAVVPPEPVLREPVAWWFGGLLGVYVAVELAVCVWLPTLLIELGVAATTAALALTVFFALRAAGRFAGIALLRRFRWPPVLALCGVLAFGCTLSGSVGDAGLALWSLPASGLFLALMYPTLNSHVISRFESRRQGAVAALTTFCSAAAAALGTAAIAAAGEAAGSLRRGFLVATVLAAVLALLLVWQAWRRPAFMRLP
jgi:fucose permease